MKVVVLFLVLKCFAVSGQTWATRARLPDATTYFPTALQQLIYEVEKKEWSSLKIHDIPVVINDHMYSWHVSGNVTYTNGFMLTTQRIDVGNIQSLFTTRTVNGTVQVTGTVRGEMNFRDMEVGFDVVFVENDGTVQRYTGAFTYVLARFLCSISKNFHTGEFTTHVSSTSLNPKYPRMIYMPANNVTEVLSRRFTPSSIGRSVGEWASDIFQPMLLKIVKTKMEFPRVCFVNC